MITANDPIPGRDQRLAQLNADILIRDYGTMWSFTPQNDDAEEYMLHLGTEAWQWAGTTLMVDHRPARDLLGHLEASSGLSIYLV